MNPLTDAQAAQALLDRTDREIRDIAKKAGVPDEAMPRAMLAFAKFLKPHAGREPSAHAMRHYRHWWRGFAAGLRVR